MSIAITKAADELISNDVEVSAHKLISLLMAGALERIEQTRVAIETNNLKEKTILWNKVVAILNGLQSNLDFEQGGQIAENLNTVYVYLIDRLTHVDSEEAELATLSEARTLMSEIKSGWDAISAPDQYASVKDEAIAC